MPFAKQPSILLLNEAGNLWARHHGYSNFIEAEQEMFGGPDDQLAQENRAFIHDVVKMAINWDKDT